MRMGNNPSILKVCLRVFSIEYALLAVQRAMLREVTPELRAVIVDLEKEKQILQICFYYDGQVNEKTLDLWDCAAAEASAALGPDCFLETQFVRLDYPLVIPLKGYYAYLRKENNGSNFKPSTQHKIKMTEQTIGYALLAMQSSLNGVVTPERPCCVNAA